MFEIEIHVVHKTCSKLAEWKEKHRQVGVYPSYKKSETHGSEQVERFDFIPNTKMVCEQCDDVIYIGVNR